MIFGKKPRMMEKFKKHYDRHKNNNFIGGGQKEFAPWGGAKRICAMVCYIKL